MRLFVVPFALQLRHVRTLGSVSLALCTLACASGPVERALERDRLDLALAAFDAEPDSAELRQIAEHVLVMEATRDDATRSQRAFSALAALGPMAEEALHAIDARVASRSTAAAATIRAHVLALRAKLGSLRARRELHGLLDDSASLDATARALAVSTLDAEHDLPQLHAHARDAAAAVRLAAVRQLPGSPPADAETLRLLTAIAHADPAPDARVAATHALGRAHAFDAVLQRLDDTLPAVRIAAVAALLDADHERAAERLRDRLGEPADAQNIEAARLLLTRAQHAVPETNAAPDAARNDAARSLLARALAGRDSALRAYAAAALNALHEPSLEPLMRERLGAEPQASTRLLLATALGTDDAAAREALAALMRNDDVTGAQAASELARGDDEAALARLRALLASSAPRVRSLAATTLARLGYVQAARAVLDDADADARVATAAAIVRGLAQAERR